MVPINGNAYFEFDVRDELRLKEDYEREYLLDALVEEKSTGSVQNFSTVITVHLDAYRVETVRIPSYYIPGVPFEVTVSMSNSGFSESGKILCTNFVTKRKKKNKKYIILNFLF